MVCQSKAHTTISCCGAQKAQLVYSVVGTYKSFVPGEASGAETVGAALLFCALRAHVVKSAGGSHCACCVSSSGSCDISHKRMRKAILFRHATSWMSALHVRRRTPVARPMVWTCFIPCVLLSPFAANAASAWLEMAARSVGASSPPPFGPRSLVIIARPLYVCPRTALGFVRGPAPGGWESSPPPADQRHVVDALGVRHSWPSVGGVKCVHTLCAHTCGARGWRQLGGSFLVVFPCPGGGVNSWPTGVASTRAGGINSRRQLGGIKIGVHQLVAHTLLAGVSSASVLRLRGPQAPEPPMRWGSSPVAPVLVERWDRFSSEECSVSRPDCS